MSLFHTMCLGTSCNFEQLKQTIDNFVSKKDFNIKDSAGVLTLCGEGLTIFIKEGTQGLAFRSQDYDLSFKFDFYIDINANYSNWAYELMDFTGNVLRYFDGDLVLEANGDTVYLMRKKSDGIVLVDDSKLRDFPFDRLGIKYKREILKQV